MHVHSNASPDGFLPPQLLVKLAREKGLTGIALTDHDSVDGIAEALEAGRSLDIDIIPSVELLAEYNGEIIHVTAPFIDCKNPELLKYLVEARETYVVNNILRVGVLLGMGLPLSKEQIFFLIDKNVCIGHKHKDKLCTDYLEEWGILKENDPTRTLVLEKLRTNYQKCKTPPLKVVITLIHKAGGLAILAHPYRYENFFCNNVQTGFDMALSEMKTCGLDGIEVYCSNYNNKQRDNLLCLANKYNLLISGGSNFHGYKGQDGRDICRGIFCDFVPNYALEEMKSYSKSH
jgi:predicted metal-dependent phosphoesterase TrpH